MSGDASYNILPLLINGNPPNLPAGTKLDGVPIVIGGSGSVTSVGLSAPSSILSVAGSPITTSGTLALSLATQTANRIWAGPATGSAATPTFRALVLADIPDLSSLYGPAVTFGTSLVNTLGTVTLVNDSTPAAGARYYYGSDVAGDKGWQPFITEGGGGGGSGDLTEATSSVLTIVGGSNALWGEGTTIQVKLAGTSQGGYLSSADWNTFNGKSTVTPAALTKSDDTNVTLTLGGTPATALLQATSLTLGWTGTLAIARGGTGAATAGAQTVFGNNTGSTAAPGFSSAPQFLKIGNLTGNGFVKTSGSDGTLGIDTSTYLTGNQTITLSSDVTGSGTTAITTTIANDAVTYAKIQNVSAASKLLGRGDSGSGDPQELTLGTNLSMSGTTVNAAGGSPGGSDTQIQFNDGGSSFGGDSDFIWNKTSNVLTDLGTFELGAASDTTIARSSAGHISIEGSVVGLASDTLSFFTTSTSNTIGVGNVELGAASDTTISRSSAGHISVEGSVVGLASNDLSFFTASTSNSIGVGNVELGHATDTTVSRNAAGVMQVEGVVVPTISSTNTITNKRNTKRALSTSGPGGTPTLNTDTYDVAHFTAVAAAITSMTTNLSGTPVQGDQLRIDFTDDGTARAIAWGTSFEDGGVALPLTTVISTRLDVILYWNTVTSKWRCMATSVFLGTATNDNAPAGAVGEYASSLVASGSAVSLTTATTANVASISLTAGDWDVGGNVNFTETTSTVTARSAGLTSTSATVPTDGSEAFCGVQSTVTSETNSITLSRKRFSLSGTTTVYLVARATFSAGTCAGFGQITARRAR